MNVSAVGSSPATAQDGKPRTIEQAGSAFEALLIGQMLKSAREAGQGSLGESDQAGGTMMEYAEEFLAQEIAKGGGLGLGKIIVSQMQKSAAAVAPKK